MLFITFVNKLRGTCKGAEFLYVIEVSYQFKIGC